MSTEINLAIRRKGESRFVNAKGIKKLRLVAAVLLFVVAMLSSGLFLVIASSPLQKLRDQEKQTEADLSTLNESFGKQLLVRSQLKDISSLLSSRPDLRNRINTVLKMIPPGLDVSDISIEQKSISMNVTTSSLGSLDSFFQAVAVNANTGQVPKNVTTSSISYAPETNQYTMQLTFTE